MNDASKELSNRLDRIGLEFLRGPIEDLLKKRSVSGEAVDKLLRAIEARVLLWNRLTQSSHSKADATAIFELVQKVDSMIVLVLEESNFWAGYGHLSIDQWTLIDETISARDERDGRQ